MLGIVCAINIAIRWIGRSIRYYTTLAKLFSHLPIQSRSISSSHKHEPAPPPQPVGGASLPRHCTENEQKTELAKLFSHLPIQSRSISFSYKHEPASPHQPVGGASLPRPFAENGQKTENEIALCSLHLPHNFTIDKALKLYCYS